MTQTATIIIIRHGEPTSAGPLTERGEAEVRSTANILLSRGFKPDRLVSSTPVRTRITMNITKHILWPDNHAKIHVEHEDLQDMSTRAFNVADFIKRHQALNGITLIAGHTETMNCFATNLLSTDDCAKLFGILPENRFQRITVDGDEMLCFLPKCGDAIIMTQTMDTPQYMRDVRDDWALAGYIADGVFIAPPDIRTAPAIRGEKTRRNTALPALYFQRRPG